MCDHCGNSGVLNVVSSASQEEVEASWDTRWNQTHYASACHCPAGTTWKEVGLDG